MPVATSGGGADLAAGHERRGRLVEEIVRIYGLDKVAKVMTAAVGDGHKSRSVTTAQRRRFIAARTLAARGMNEAMTWSFLPKLQAELFGGGDRSLELANPISTELSDMRPSLLPNLIAAAGSSMARGFADLAIFEVGQIYGGDRRRTSAFGLRCAAWSERSAAPRRGTAVRRSFRRKGGCSVLLTTVGAPIDRLRTVAEGPSWYHPGRVGALMLGPKNRLALFGEIHPRVLAAMDVAGPLVAFEVDLNAVPQPKSARTSRSALDASQFQAVTRDFAFVVASDVPADKLVNAAKSADKGLVESGCRLRCLRYRRSHRRGRKSIAIEVMLQPPDRTLTEEEIDKVSAAIVEAVRNATGGELRT